FLIITGGLDDRLTGRRSGASYRPARCVAAGYSKWSLVHRVLLSDRRTGIIAYRMFNALLILHRLSAGDHNSLVLRLAALLWACSE
ncbi:unnamed protein product, partial [Arctogadus glacialis]